MSTTATPLPHSMPRLHVEHDAVLVLPPYELHATATTYRGGRYPFRSVLGCPTRATLHKLPARSVLSRPCLAPSPVVSPSTDHAILYHSVAMWPRGLTARSCSFPERGGEHTGPALRAVCTISAIRRDIPGSRFREIGMLHASKLPHKLHADADTAFLYPHVYVSSTTGIFQRFNRPQFC